MYNNFWLRSAVVALYSPLLVVTFRILTKSGPLLAIRDLGLATLFIGSAIFIHKENRKKISSAGLFLGSIRGVLFAATQCLFLVAHGSNRTFEAMSTQLVGVLSAQYLIGSAIERRVDYINFLLTSAAVLTLFLTIGFNRGDILALVSGVLQALTGITTRLSGFRRQSTILLLGVSMFVAGISMLAAVWLNGAQSISIKNIDYSQIILIALVVSVAQIANVFIFQNLSSTMSALTLSLRVPVALLVVFFEAGVVQVIKTIGALALTAIVTVALMYRQQGSNNR